MKVKVIIGANYGDEGKGLTTSYFTITSEGRTLNVLHNGGCQRGHTVNTNGKRHVFHCFGSGSLNGAATYYHPNFLADPVSWSIEVDQLGFAPELYVNSHCRVVTPYDIALNRAKEVARGINKHGSCGLGIFDTITRHKTIPLYISDLLDEQNLYSKLQSIKEYYKEQCKINNYPLEDITVDTFFRSVHLFKQSVNVVNEHIYNYGFNNIIFEGGQGLRLDMDNMDDFPHLTPSSTGLKVISNDIENLVEKYDADVEVVYITRPYLTRHGAGPLFAECKREELSENIIDKTNQPNPWQDSIRFAPLELRTMINFIEKDKEYLWDKDIDNNVKFGLAITQNHLNGGKLFTTKGNLSIEESELMFHFDRIHTFIAERFDVTVDDLMY